MNEDGEARIMDLLIIRDGEPGDVSSVMASEDPALTDAGMIQVCSTVSWMSRQMRLRNFVGYTSPARSALQTASAVNAVLRIPFTVDESLLDFKPISTSLPDRSSEFQNLRWNPKDWSGKREFEPESTSELVRRCQCFLEDCADREHIAVMAVTHGLTTSVLAELASLVPPELVEERLRLLFAGGDKSPLEGSFLAGKQPPCGVTLFHDGKPVWRSKIVY